MLTNEQIEALVAKINAKINLPVLGEKAEMAIFRMAVKQILKFLENNVPQEWTTLINDTSDGLTEEESNAIVEKLVRFMNSKIDIPLLEEDMESKVFELVVKSIVEAMTKNKNLDTALELDVVEGI